jgi:NAD(P)-dependent dehydrogenase (short-subunit alcohol dehydrogenase family)
VRAADVSDHEAVRALARDLTAHHGAMDVLMNIAGISA